MHFVVVVGCCFIIVRPKMPFLELLTKPIEGNIFKSDTEFRARCISGEASPAANISWYLDNIPLDRIATTITTNKIERVMNTTVSDVQIFTSKQEISWRLTPEDNNRMLICTTPHLTDSSQQLTESTSYKLNVQCRCF